MDRLITEEAYSAFAERGYVRLPGFLPPESAEPAMQRIQRVLARAAPSDSVTAVRKRLKPHARLPEFSALLTLEVCQCASELAGGQTLSEIVDRPQILFSPPDASIWTVPHKIWHLDIPRLGAVGLVGVQMFTFLDKVEAGGGGTVVVAGSHRLLNDEGRIRSKDVKRRLSKEAYFQDLFNGALPDRERFVDEIGHVEDVPLQVVEFTGEPGDVYFSDLRVLHSLASNVRNAPRLMLTQRFFATEEIGALYAGET